MVSLAERLEVGCIRVGQLEGPSPDPSDFVLLGQIPEPAEVGLLEIELMGQRLISGLFFRCSTGETDIVASALPVHLTWTGVGLREADGPPEYELSAYRRRVI
jgi:hypothetical protein